MTNKSSEKLFEIFFPRAKTLLDRVKNNQTRFVHYTSAATAFKIIKSQEFWLREPSCMNDFSEVEHGMRCISNIYSKDEIGKVLQKELELIREGITFEIENLFKNSFLNPRKNNFIGCLSEHRNEEDVNGRLSMWRAYGQGSGVAIVMNSKPIVAGPGLLKIQTCPVSYYNEDHFKNEIQKIISNILQNTEFLKSQSNMTLGLVCASMFRMFALSSKHPAFHEELEWRLIYSPDIAESDYMIKDLNVVNGIPQIIYKIPLKSAPGNIKLGGELSDLVDRIIIGPTEFPIATAKAFAVAMGEVGIKNPDDKIVISGIPLRT